MSNAATQLALVQIRTVRRLGRLFRVERTGRLERRPFEVSQRLIGRRAGLVDELVRLDAARRSLAVPPSDELSAAIRDLAGEVDRLQALCAARIEALTLELRQRRGAGQATGLRDGAGGRILGSG
jgi:hypothetical protein